MRVRGHVVLDSETWSRLCAILIGIFAATVVLIVANIASHNTLFGQGEKSGLEMVELINNICLYAHSCFI